MKRSLETDSFFVFLCLFLCIFFKTKQGYQVQRREHWHSFGIPLWDKMPNINADKFPDCVGKLAGRTFDILWNGKNQFLVHFEFKADGTIHSNQTMFDGAPWRAVKGNQFEVGRKNGSFVLWEFMDEMGREAFRTDRKLFGMRLTKNQIK